MFHFYQDSGTQDKEQLYSNFELVNVNFHETNLYEVNTVCFKK